MGNRYLQFGERGASIQRILLHPANILILFMLFVTSWPVFAQKPEKVPAQPVICPASFQDMFTHTPPPEKFLKARKTGAREAATATFEVTFGPGAQANAEARAAFEFALDIWANEIVSAVPIKVYADFATLGTGVLASSGPSYNVRDFEGAPEPGVFYPAALANALAGEVLFPDEEYDFVVNLGNGIPWYFGLDGNTPSGLYDFATVALHEMGHGLGFTAIRGYDAGVGSLRSNGFPSVYSLFPVDGSGMPLLDYPDPSTELGDQLTGGDIFMNGTFAKAGLGGERPELYAPSTWQGGSSYAHWDEAAFPAGDPNSLMTPQAGSAESNFDIGDITRGLFKDMGWVLNDDDAPPIVATPGGFSEELFVGDTAIRMLTLSSIADSTVMYEIDTDPEVSWLSFNPDSGMLESGASEDVAILIDSDGLTKGIYETDIIITTNGNPDTELTVSVSLRVLDGTEKPVIAVSPDSISETLQQLETSTRTLTIENSGDADLMFNIMIDDLSGNDFKANVEKTLGAISDNSIQRYTPNTNARVLNKSISAAVMPEGTELSKLITSLYATDFEAFTPGELNGQQGWASQFAGNFVISDEEPFEGGLHFRGISDGLGSTRPASILALSPTVTPLDEPFTVASAEVNISGSGVTWEFIPQSQTQESVVTRLRFLADGTIDVLDQSTGGYVEIPAEIPEGYFTLKVVSDKDDASMRIFFDDELVYAGVGYATQIEQVVILSAMEVAGPTFDMDNLEISDGDPDAFFVSVLPNQGTVPFGSSVDVSVKFDARSLDPGTYNANLVVTSNDVENPSITVPVELTVTVPPTITVEPDSLVAVVDVTVDDPPVVTRTFTIGNTGENTLEFTTSLGSTTSSSDELNAATQEILASLNMADYGVGNNSIAKESFVKATKVEKKAGGQMSNALTYTDSIYYDSGISFPDNFSGLDTSPYTSAIKFEVDEPFTLSAVRNAYRTEAVADPVIIMEIYKGGSTPADGELLLEQTINTASAEGIFKATELNSSLSFDAGEVFWVVHKYPEGVSFPQGTDDTATQKPETYFYSGDGGASYNPSGFVFLIRALSGEDNSYITLEPASGEVEPGMEVEVTATFDGSQLANGTYHTDILISSNDPLNSVVKLPTVFSVSGQIPSINLSDEVLLFGDVFVGGERTLPFYIINDGLDVLNVSNISSDNEDFTVDISETTVAARDSVAVMVTFTPDAVGNSNGIITIASDAPENSTMQVVVAGVGSDPPVIVLDPQEQAFTTDAGTMVNASLKVKNEGNYPLLFSVPNLAAMAALTDPNVQLNNTEKIEFKGQESLENKATPDTREGHQVLYSVGTDNGFGYSWIDSNEDGGPVYNFNDITTTGTEITGDVGGDGSYLIDLPFEFTFYGDTKGDVYVNANGFLTFQDPPPTTWVNTQIPDVAGPEDIIAGFWDDLEPQTDDGSVHYQLYDDRLVVQWTDAPQFSSAAVGTVTFQIVLYSDGNIDIFYEDVETASFAISGTVGIENGDGTDGAQVAFNTSYIEDGLALRFIKPLRSLTPFISEVAPLSGVVPAGGEKTLSIVLDATDLNNGVYYDELVVSSNDPVTPSATAFFELTVLGYPEIMVEPDTLEFDPIFVGLSSEGSFIIKNTGSKTLEISDISNSNSDFALDISGPQSLLPDESLSVSVTFTPTSIGTIEDEVIITSNDAFGNEMAMVKLIGVGLDPPVIMVEPDSIATTVPQGGEVTEILGISNTGGSDLNYAVSLPYFANGGDDSKTVNNYKILDFEDITSKEQPDNRVGSPFLNASGGPGTFGYRWVDNNSGGPAYDFMDISTTGNLIDVGGDGDTLVALPFTFKFFGEDQDSVTIGANGFLTFGSIVGNNFINQQIPNSDNPNNVIAGLWDDLEPQNGGGVFYMGTEDYFIVQFESVPGFGFPPFIPEPPPVTFQMILYPDGTIKLQYENVDSSIATSSTVGLEGPMGMSGLQVIFNSSYLTNELAITFTPPISGTVAPGETVDVPVTFDATGLEPGVYDDVIVVYSNDPVTPQVDVPVHLEVISVPKVASFTLIDATNNEEIGELTDGEVIDLNDFISNSFSVRANTDPATVGSVVFDFNGIDKFQRENSAPYSLKGDKHRGTVYNGVEFPVGENVLTATPYSKSNGKGETGMALTVHFEVIQNQKPVYSCYGSQVLLYMAGERKNGSDITASRSNPDKALGAPQENDNYNFVALGFGGSIEIMMDCEVMDHDGGDLLVVETSFRDNSSTCSDYPEKAMVEASEDGINWVVVASEVCKDGEVDLANGGLQRAQYFRITDISDPSDFRSGFADGYDLDGLVALTGQDSTSAQMTEAIVEQQNVVANEEDVEITAYPNPVTDMLKISLKGQEDKTVIANIYSATGYVNYHVEFNVTAGIKYREMDMSNLPTGIYYLRLSNTDHGVIAVKKLIKN